MQRLNSTLYIITGASRGIGAAAAIELSRIHNENAEFILLARDYGKLVETKNSMITTSKMNENSIKLIQIDFSNKNLEITDYKELLTKELSKTSKSFDELIVLYNHGTLDYGLIENANNQILQDKFQTNFFSIWLLLNAVQSLFPESLIKKQTHININSSLALLPSINWSIQCCARSSRLMLFNCLAIEKPHLRVLSYDPGIVYTDGAKLVYEENLFSESFKNDYENGVFVTANETIVNLIRILEENKFENGSLVRYAPYKLNSQ